MKRKALGRVRPPAFWTPAPVRALDLRMFLWPATLRSGAGSIARASVYGGSAFGEGGTVACSEREIILKLSPAKLLLEVGVAGGRADESRCFMVEARSGGVLGRMGLVMSVEFVSASVVISFNDTTVADEVEDLRHLAVLASSRCRSIRRSGGLCRVVVELVADGAAQSSSEVIS